MMGMMAIGLAVSLLGHSVPDTQRGGQKSDPQQEPLISLAAAVAIGLVTVSIHGQGGSSGDVIHLRVRRTMNRTLRLRLEPGTVFRSASPAVQNMLVAALKGELTNSEGEYLPAATIELKDDKERSYLVEAYCLDFERENPGPGDSFTFEAIAADALAVLNAIPERDRTIPIVQAALWLWQGVPEEEIRTRFSVTSEDFIHARNALQKLPAKGR